MTSTLINELTLLREAARRGADNAEQVEAVTRSICRQSDAEKTEPQHKKGARNG